MKKRRRMKAKQVMRFLNRSRSGLTFISDKLKPIPSTNPTAEREYWHDEVVAFKIQHPVNKTKQRAGKKSRRTKTVSLAELAIVIVDNDRFYSALESRTDRD